jgi:hypothetical protein
LSESQQREASFAADPSRKKVRINMVVEGDLALFLWNFRRQGKVSS